MAPGDKRHYITIQNPSYTQDSIGNEIITWADFAKVYADVREISGREYFAAKQTSSEATVKVTIRPIPGVDSRMRILHQNRILQLVSPPIDPDGRGRVCVLMCKDRD